MSALLFQECDLLKKGLAIQTLQNAVMTKDNNKLKRKVDRLQIELAKQTAKSEGMVAIGANGTKQY